MGRSGFEPVPLDSSDVPRRATFDFDRSGSILLAAIAERDKANHVLLARFTDGTWSSPEVAATASDHPQRLLT